MDNKADKCLYLNFCAVQVWSYLFVLVLWLQCTSYSESMILCKQQIHTYLGFLIFKYNDSTIYKWNRKWIFTLIRKSHCFIFTAPMHHFFLAKNVIGEKSFLKKWVKWHLMTWIKRIDRWISKSLNGLKGDTRKIGKFTTNYSLFYV